MFKRKNKADAPKPALSVKKERFKIAVGFLKKHRKKFIITAIIIVLIAALGVIIAKKKSGGKTDNQIQLSTVTRGDVEKTITGSAAVEPYERYEIIPLVNGEITDAPYEVGDFVNEGDVLYTFDMSDVQLSMQKQQNSMQKSEISRAESQKDIEKLTVTAPCDGIISGMNVSAGDEIANNAEIATVSDTQKMKVELPFNAEQIKHISKGQTAVLSSSAHMSSVNGKVTHVSNSAAAQEDGSMLYTVEVVFDNPGSFTSGIQLGGEINGMVSPGGGEAKCYSEGKAKTETDGTVTKVYHSNGDYVSKGEAIIAISNDTVENSVKKAELDYSDAQIALQEQQEKLDDYIITAPISGTVITKNSKAGDTIDKTNASITMMVVADVSKLKFALEIDELDVGLVNVGQEVEITCDAVEGKTFKGSITEMSMEGTATNGVTTYQATVTIDEPGELKPSMNVDATVIIDSAENVLRVPTTDIKTAMGKSYVFVKDDGKSKNTDEKSNGAEQTEKMPAPPADGTVPNGENRARGSGRPQSADEASGSAPAQKSESGNGEKSANKQSGDDTTSGKSGSADNRSRVPEAPEGFKTVEITIGIEGDDYTEVKSGLSEGDQIYKQTVSSSSNQMMPGMMGGMPGGGMPGGAPGGAPGGGNRSSGAGGNRSGGGAPR